MKEGEFIKVKKILFIFIVLLACNSKANAETLTKSQQKKADYLAYVCEKEWERYGVLPSVCIGQAITESGLGKVCRKNNLWGLGAGRYSYKSLKSGTYAYLRCINNGYYKKAPHQKKYKKQIYYISKGGYATCSTYYSSVCNVIERYNLEKYDKKMFRNLKEKKYIEKLKEEFSK